MLEEEPKRPRKQAWMGQALSGQWAPLQLALGPPDPPALLSCVSSEWGWAHGGIGWFTSPGRVRRGELGSAVLSGHQKAVLAVSS